MTRAIFDPRMLTTLADYFPSLCTIQEPTEVEDASGSIIEGWADFAGHVDLPCAHGPNKGREVKLADQTYVVSNYTLSLRGYYPTITEKMRIVVDGRAFDIMLVQTDSHGMTTRILTSEVTSWTATGLAVKPALLPSLRLALPNSLQRIGFRRALR